MAAVTWLRTNGVNTKGAAAKVMSFDRLGETVRPGNFTGYREYPTRPSVKKHKKCRDPISADPICPFPKQIIGDWLLYYIILYYIILYDII